ncbi:MAG: ribosomal-protein-alanine N-acetyltransferase, partial [Candidatus Thermofonsia Clade 3 bacterium]
MSIHDIPIIEELEKRCFSAPWSGDVYRHELTSNRLGSYWVMRRASGSDEGTPPILAY